MSGYTKYWILAAVVILAFILRPTTEIVRLTKTVHVEKRKVFDILKDPYGFLQLHPTAVEVKILEHKSLKDVDSVIFDVIETINVGNTSARVVLSNNRKNIITMETTAVYSIVKALITWELSNSKSNNKETFIQENFTITAPWIARSQVIKVIRDAHIQMLQKLDSLDITLFEQ